MEDSFWWIIKKLAINSSVIGSKKGNRQKSSTVTFSTEQKWTCERVLQERGNLAELIENY